MTESTMRWLPGVSLVAIALLTPAAARAADAPTFTKDVAPILMRSCVQCHRQQRGYLCRGHRPPSDELSRQLGGQQEQPDPNNWAGGGERTVDEMSIAHIDLIYLSDVDDEAARKGRATTEQQQQ